MRNLIGNTNISYIDSLQALTKSFQKSTESFRNIGIDTSKLNISPMSSMELSLNTFRKHVESFRNIGIDTSKLNISPMSSMELSLNTFRKHVESFRNIGIDISKLREVIVEYNRLDLSGFNEVISLYDNLVYDSNEVEETDITKIQLEDIENIINAKLETKSEDCIATANEIIDWLKDIKEGQDQIINNASNMTFKQIFTNILIGLLVNIIFLVGQNFYNYINQPIESNPKKVIQIVKEEFKKITLDNDNYNMFMYNNKEKLEVRNSKSNKSPIIYKLEIASVVEVIVKQKEWVNIKFIDKNTMEEREGWVLSKYLKTLKST